MPGKTLFLRRETLGFAWDVASNDNDTRVVGNEEIA